MMASSPSPRHGPVVEAALDDVEAEFLALICADEELLRTEFDAIIAEGWGQPAPPTPPRRSRCPAQPAQPGRGRAHGPADRLTGSQHRPAAEGRHSQRAPPPR